MSASNDIRSLFKQFGGEPELYQEFTRDEHGRGGSPRWPLLPGSPVPELAPLSALAPEPSPAPFGGAEQQAPAAQAEAHDWSAAGLRNLLAKMAENPTPASVGTPRVAQLRPALEHIRVISVISAKGGVGKTTLAASLASALRRAGRQVVAIDLDPQNALHHHFQAAEASGSVMEDAGVVQAGQPWQELGKLSDDGVFVVAHGMIDENHRQEFEQGLHHDPLWLARHLADMQLAEGTIVVVDTPPGPSVYLRQALSVANLAVVVSLADPASYTSLPQVDKLIAAYTQERTDFAGAAYVINQVDHSRQMNKNITQILRGLLGKQMIGLVHRDQSISDALAYNRNVLGYDPHGRGCHDILDCAQALIGRLAIAAPTAQ
ncbi:cellulose synthase operon protein YhjQ [Pseudomonas xanthosomatis]|uniref:cellulose biosynthesis protein BcsQ n=1 Tax=Pseudomonas xanthosomatis TaxID=2842356 RepID=UPI001C3DC39B|nr:cellulose biosynthesis protein BcsQ [Pseudomonas xanthosomatis]QXH46580.1 cellulose synthase operon protein YhjQ [Pseudomonas xanthosomatis]